MILGAMRQLLPHKSRPQRSGFFGVRALTCQCPRMRLPARGSNSPTVTWARAHAISARKSRRRSWLAWKEEADLANLPPLFAPQRLGAAEAAKKPRPDRQQRRSFSSSNDRGLHSHKPSDGWHLNGLRQVGLLPSI